MSHFFQLIMLAASLFMGLVALDNMRRDRLGMMILDFIVMLLFFFASFADLHVLPH